MKVKFRKPFTALLICGILVMNAVCSAGAAWDGYKETGTSKQKILVDMGNLSNIISAGAVPSDKKVTTDRFSAHWKNHTKTTTLNFNSVERDWSEYSIISFDMYSEKATNATLVFLIYADLVPTPGKTMSYFRYDVTLNFTGWKHMEINSSDFRIGNFADWAKINKMQIVASGWDAIPSAESDVYITSIYGIVDEDAEAASAVDSMEVSEKNQKEVYTALGNSIAVMNFADNAVKNSAIVPMANKDRVITAENESVAPLSFFENVLGAEVNKEKGGLSVTLDGKTADLKDIVLNYDDIDYLPLNSALSALGKNSETFDMVTVIGDADKIEAVKGSSKILKNLQIMLSANVLTEKDITKADWRYLKDKWRKYLVGDETQNLEDEAVIKKISRIDSNCESAMRAMKKDNEVFALFGTNPVTVTDHMTAQFVNFYKLVRAYGTYGSKYYKDQALKRDIMYGFEWLYENLYGQDEIDGKGWRSTSEYNWWDWYCGSAMPLCEALLVMENDLNPTLVKKYLSLYEHLRLIMRTEPGNAASRIYTGTAAAALLENFDRMKNMVVDYNMLLRGSGSGSGVQEDWLYIAHSYFAYSTGYGTGSLLDRLTKVEAILGGTAFEFATPYKYNSCIWMYETFGPIMFNGFMTNAQSGRLKVDETGYTAMAIGAMLDFIGVFGKDDDIKLKQFIKRNIREENIDIIETELEIDQVAKLQEVLKDTSIPDEPYYRSKIYYTGDSVIHQRDDYGFALSMSSTRIAGWESINADNMTGWYQGDGMLYTYVDTDPFAYNRAYWRSANPYHMPGTTVDTQERIATSIKNSKEVLTNQDFVGAAGINDLYSTSAMQLESYHNDNENAVLSTADAGGDAPYHQSSLMAKKAWFMFDDELVALGSDINANDGFEVQTIIENRKLTKSEIISQTEETEDSGLAKEYEIVSVTASADDGNVPGNLIDGDYTTRWSAEGDAYAVFELSEAVPIGYVGIAQFNGTEGKQAIFELETSLDGENWTKIWEGKASGQTASMEPYDMKGTLAKYVKYSGHGRTNSMWNSVTELKIFAPMADGSMPVDGELAINRILGIEKITVDGTVLEKESTYRKSFTDPKWMNIEGISGYYFPQGGKMEMDKVTNTANYLEVWLSHGISPKKGTYSYVVLPKKTPEETAAYSENPDIEIISNTEKIQAVKENTLDVTGMVFWEAGSLNDITVSEPMIVMAENKDGYYNIGISDPTKKLTNAKVTLQGNYEAVECDERCTVNSDKNKTEINIDFSGSKGRTLPVKLKLN